MINREIKEFKTVIGAAEFPSCKVPFSLYSVLTENDVTTDGLEGRAISFTAPLRFSSQDMLCENIFVRIHDIPYACEILVSGSVIAEIDTPRRGFTYNIKPLISEGDHTLEIRVKSNNVLDSGVFGRVEIIKSAYSAISRVKTSQIHEDGCVTFVVDLETVGAAVKMPGERVDKNSRAVATLVSSSGQIYYAGLTDGTAKITVNDPLYWWPLGQGVQNLYTLTVNLYGDMEVEDTYEVRVGLRSLTTARTADGSILEVNGRSFVPMGVTYHTHKRRFVANATAATEAEIVTAAKAGCNTIVIPAGCDIPNEKFFELCDIYGIVAVRETDNINYDAQLLTDISYHASLGLIDYVDRGVDLEAVSDKLCTISKDLDFAVESEAAKYVSMPSLAAYKTLISQLSQSERNLFSEKVEEGAPDEVRMMICESSKRFLYASNIYDFSYISQLTQIAVAEDVVAEARINRNARAVFSSLGDSDKLVSDSITDTMSRHKAMVYRASRLFAPVATVVRRKGASVELYISNESRSSFVGSLELRIKDAFNNIIHSENISCVAEQAGATFIGVKDLSEWVCGHEREYYLEYVLKSSISTVHRGTLLFVPQKRFRYEAPNITADIVGEGRRFSITLYAEAFADSVEIDFEGTDAVFLDNYVTMTKNSPLKISFNVIGDNTTAQKLMGELRIKSVYDIGKSYI